MSKIVIIWVFMELGELGLLMKIFWNDSMSSILSWEV